MKKYFSRITATISFRILCIAFVCFIIAFIGCTWKVVEPLYEMIWLLLLPALLYGVLALFESLDRWKTVTNCVSILLFVPVLAVSVWFFLYILFSASGSSENPACYPRAYRFYRDVPGMEYFPSEIPEEAENVSFTYVSTYGPGSDNFDRLRLICTVPDPAKIHEQYADAAIRSYTEEEVMIYVLFEGEWKRESSVSYRDVICRVTVNDAENIVCYDLRIEK